MRSPFQRPGHPSPGAVVQPIPRRATSGRSGDSPPRRGNRLLWVVGDLYQILEFLLPFLLARALITTERQFRTIAIVMMGAIVATSGLQVLDDLAGAHYLSEFRLQRSGSDEMQRLINMN